MFGIQLKPDELVIHPNRRVSKADSRGRALGEGTPMGMVFSSSRGRKYIKRDGQIIRLKIDE